MMRRFFAKRENRVLIAALLVIGVAVLWANRFPREPVLRGMTLSWWFTEGFDRTGQFPTAGELRSLGPGAVAWLGYKAGENRPWLMDEPEGWFQRKLWWLYWSERSGELQQFKTDFESIRYGAIVSLASLGPDAAPAIPSLVRAVRAEGDGTRTQAAKALMEMGPVSWPAVRDAIESGDPKTRSFLVGYLDARWRHRDGQSDPREFAETVALLVPLTLHQDEYLGMQAGQILQDCGEAWRDQPRVSEGVKLVAASLARYPAALQRTTAQFLADLQKDAAAAIPALTELAEIPDELTRVEILGALCRIEPGNTRWLEKLRELAASPNAEIANAAKIALFRAWR